MHRPCAQHDAGFARPRGRAPTAKYGPNCTWDTVTGKWIRGANSKVLAQSALAPAQKRPPTWDGRQAAQARIRAEREALDELYRKNAERNEEESRKLAEQHARDVEQAKAAKALAALKDAHRPEEEAAKTRCEQWARAAYERDRGLYPKATYYYMTGDLCMKTLHPADESRSAVGEKRSRESSVVESYAWKKETRRVDGPDEARDLDQGEWELAEVWVRYRQRW